MRSFRDRPIKQKLVITTMVTTTVALLVVGIAVVTADYVLYRDYLRRDLSSLARIIADNSTAALAFNDPDSAAQTLGALRARTHVAGACIYRMDGTMLAQYSPASTFTCPPPENQQIRSTGDFLIIDQPIVLSGRAIGTLVLQSDLALINERVRLYGTTVLGVLLATFFLAFLLSSRLRSVIATPISRLVSATTSVSETGDYSIRAPKQSGDELGVLVDRFNEMLAGIQSRENDLKKALADREAALDEVEKERERFAFMAESMPQKIFTASPTGESLYLNKLWMDFTGLPFEQLKEWGWEQFIHPDDLEESLRVWRRSIETGQPLQLTNRFRRADGVYRWHLNRARAMRNAEGEIILWVGSSTEIHEQKEAEEELRRANEDLQQFAYSASHDLQEPIRNVAVYSEIIARRYQDALDDEGRQFLGFLREGGRRLATLVNDLLAYTRASMAELSATTVSATTPLQNALAGLAEAIRESGAQVTYDSLPEVYIGEAHLQQVFQNLIANALKYRNADPPRIHISAAHRGGEWYFAVEDNGIGIEPQYKEKIFGVFKRLHHDQKYSGTGIGLAICQRVVERYGGRIWVESEPGKGSTFFFSVPHEARPARSAAAQSSPG
ncbi:MAG TPA: ATP-binding protein [Bryobacteraceae bacterium]|nr:ATP-binding protein [Bryobacteraceae bacterium]